MLYGAETGHWGQEDKIFAANPLTPCVILNEQKPEKLLLIVVDMGECMEWEEGTKQMLVFIYEGVFVFLLLILV